MDAISPVYARLLLRELERREIDPRPLLTNTALNREELLQGGDISMQDFLHILRAGDRLLGNQQLGLMLGRKANVFAMGSVGAAMAVAPSLREGLQALESFTRLHATYIDIAARSVMQWLTVVILYRHDTGYVERFHTETAMLLLQQYMETLVGEPVCDARYRFAFPEPENSEEYTNALHGFVSFNADANEVDIPQRWLDLPSPYFDPELWQRAQITLSQSLKEQSTAEGAPYTQHVTALLETSEPPLPELGEVASSLHISTRSLNRHLKAEKTSFRELKRQALISRARLYLRHTDYSVDVIAVELGYTDAANFRRAFRKAAGLSPMEYRQAASAANG